MVANINHFPVEIFEKCKKKHFQSNEMPIFDDDGGHHHQWELYSS